MDNRAQSYITDFSVSPTVLRCERKIYTQATITLFCRKISPAQTGNQNVDFNLSHDYFAKSFQFSCTTIHYTVSTKHNSTHPNNIYSVIGELQQMLTETGETITTKKQFVHFNIKTIIISKLEKRNY